MSFNISGIKESGDWFKGISPHKLGTLLDPEALRIAMVLRLDCKVYKSHTCIYGEVADELGYHGYLCKKSAGRFYCHSNSNDILK